MAKKLTKCAICGGVGGRFRYRVGSEDYVHVGRCVSQDAPRDGMHKNWPLVTSHIAGPEHGPMEIQSLQHLRRVEKEYGVSSGVYSYDEHNW